jgi:hypothetical protein
LGCSAHPAASAGDRGGRWTAEPNRSTNATCHQSIRVTAVTDDPSPALWKYAKDQAAGSARSVYRPRDPIGDIATRAQSSQGGGAVAVRSGFRDLGASERGCHLRRRLVMAGLDGGGQELSAGWSFGGDLLSITGCVSGVSIACGRVCSGALMLVVPRLQAPSLGGFR